MNFVADTHALIWWFTDSPRISDNFMLIALDYSILQKMIDLKEIPELHDKIIASTAKYLNLPIITIDEFLQNTLHLKTVW